MNWCNVVLLNGKDREHKLNNAKPVNHATHPGNSVISKKDTRAKNDRLIDENLYISIIPG